MTTQITVPASFLAKVRGVEFAVEPQTLPEASLDRIFAYGLQRILNDACAGAKDDDEAKASAQAKWDNLVNGVLRASPNREGDPVKAEAKRIALGHVTKAKNFIAWLQANGLKQSDKDAKAKASELATALAAREDILAQAKANVEGAKALEIEIDI